MRIGFDAHVLDGRDQGTKTLMLRLIEAVARRHPEHEIYVYCERRHPALDWTQANLHHRPLVHRGAARHLLVALPRADHADRLDTLVFNFIQSPLVRHATVMIHDILPQTHPRFFSATFVARCWTFFGMSALLARNLFTISEHSRQAIRRVYPWTRRQPITVLHIGASFPQATYFNTPADRDPLPPAIPPGTRYALVVGRIEARKQVQLAIDAFRAGAPADVRLVIVGRREPGFVIDSGGDSRVVEIAGVSDDDLIALYRGAGLFLYPSVAEGFGLPLLDAILFGLPVIASRLTSMAEVGEGGAIFFDPEAPDAQRWLGDRIARHFQGDPVPCPTLSMRRARAALYSWNTAADELVAGITSAR